MKTLCLMTGLTAYISLAGSQPSTEAAFHLWHVKEVYSNASGSVQFVEMFDSFGGENYVGDMTLRAESDGVIKDFTFPDVVDTDVDSTERHILIATSGFGALPGGVVPDFSFDQGGVTGQFFNPNAALITITFFGSGDAISFTGDSLPKDGINSLTDTNASGPPFFSTPNLISDVNSPTNFHNGTGSVNLANPSPTGDYNGNHLVDAADYAIWRKTLNTGASPQGSGADGDSSGTIDAGDYTYWRTRFGNAAGSGALGVGSVPEPALTALSLSGLLLLLWRRRLSRSIS